MRLILLHADHKNFIYSSRLVLLTEGTVVSIPPQKLTPKKTFWVWPPQAWTACLSLARLCHDSSGHSLAELRERSHWDFPAHRQNHKSKDVASWAKSDSPSAIAAAGSMTDGFYHARGRTQDAEPPPTPTAKISFHLPSCSAQKSAFLTKW